MSTYEADNIVVNVHEKAPKGFKFLNNYRIQSSSEFNVTEGRPLNS